MDSGAEGGSETGFRAKEVRIGMPEKCPNCGGSLGAVGEYLVTLNGGKVHVAATCDNKACIREVQSKNRITDVQVAAVQGRIVAD